MGRQLTLDEHRAIGATLAMIRYECGAADRLNEFKKGSLTHRRLHRVEKDIDRLRSRLEDLSLAQHGDAARPSVYYVNQPPREGHAVDALLDHLRYTVGDVINGKVRAAVIDLYLRIDRSLWSLKMAIADRPEDKRRPLIAAPNSSETGPDLT